MKLNPTQRPASSILETLAGTLLYEGYSLYPYKRSALKNAKPIPMGVVYPQTYSNYHPEALPLMQAECIVLGRADVELDISVRFLHLRRKELLGFNPASGNSGTEEEDFLPVGSLCLEGRHYSAGWEAVERNITPGSAPLSKLVCEETSHAFEFPETVDSERIKNGNGAVAGRSIRFQSGIEGRVHIAAEPLKRKKNCFRITARVENTSIVNKPGTTTRDEIFNQSFLSTHIVLSINSGTFISMQNPEEQWRAAAEACQNVNSWPILVEKSNNCMLASPIILYDYPQIDPRSKGDLFDSTEIEEALLLHVAVLSDEEKRQIAQSDEKLRAMLDRVGKVTPEELIGLHGGMKDISKKT